MLKKRIVRTLLILLTLMMVGLICTACVDNKTNPNPDGGGQIQDEPDHYVKSFEVTTNPRLQYVAGEKPDLKTLDIKVVWEDNVEWTISDGDIALTALTVIPKTITESTTELEIIFDEYSVKLPITVGAPDGLKVERNPAKMSYSVGETFDARGMIVKAYIGEKEWEITDYTCAPNGLLQATDKEITISYKGVSVKLPITMNVTKTVYIEAEDCTLKDVSSVGQVGNIACKAQKSPPGQPGSDLLEKASGGDYVMDGYEGDSISFSINSTSATTAKLKLTASSNATEVGTGTQSSPSIANDMQVNKVYKISVNGQDITISDDVIIKGVEIKGGSRETWVYWRILEIATINLVEGENKIVLTYLPDAGYRTSYGQIATGHIDAFEIVFD